jgi:hypothetical protein
MYPPLLISRAKSQILQIGRCRRAALYVLIGNAAWVVCGVRRGELNFGALGGSRSRATAVFAFLAWLAMYDGWRPLVMVRLVLLSRKHLRYDKTR